MANETLSRKQLKHYGRPQDVRLKHLMARMLLEQKASGKAVGVPFLSANWVRSSVCPDAVAGNRITDEYGR
jgi:hypothetical protein